MWKSRREQPLANARWVSVVSGWLLPLGLVLLSLILLVFMSTAYWRAAGVGSQIQVPMFYDAHYLFPRPWTQAQTAPGIPPASPIALYDPNEITQTFEAATDKLAMISLWLAGPSGSQVHMTLSDEQGQIWQRAVTLIGDPEGRQYDVGFPAIPDSKGRRFSLTISAPGVTRSRPVIASSVGGDRLGGALRLNEFSDPGNLALTTYAKGMPGIWWLEAVGEQLLPSVFRLRLQQYKPAPLKGSVFSFLLVSTALLSVVLLVLASPQRKPGNPLDVRRLARTAAWSLLFILGSFLIWQIASGRVLFASDSNQPSNRTAQADAEALASDQRLVIDLINNLWTAKREPEPRFITTTLHDGYPALKVPGTSRIRYAFTVAPDSILSIGSVADGTGQVNSKIKVNDTVIFDSVTTADANGTGAFTPFVALDLDPWAGQGVILSLETNQLEGEAGGIWLMPQVLSQRPWLLEEIPNHPHFLPVHARFGNVAELVGITVDDAGQHAEQPFVVSLIWRSLQDTDRSAKVFVHLLDKDGQIVAQHDGIPVGGAVPVYSWPVNAVVEDIHTLTLPSELASGPFKLAVGIYDPTSLERWDGLDALGAPLAESMALIELPVERIP